MANLPKMKLKLNTGQAVVSSKPSASQTSTPSTAIRLNFSKSVSASSPPSVAPSAIPSSATLKIKTGSTAKSGPGSAKKRRREDETDDLALSTSSAKKQATSTKLNLSQKALNVKASVIKLKGKNGVRASRVANPTLTRLKIKARGKLPLRPLGVGYDSEAEDAELDPANEDNIILRMAPGADCEYLQNTIEERKVGLPVSQGGADISMRFFTRDGRRAVVTVRGRHYAAILVDLPCIIESMKSWDKRGWWKSADICQMLLVLGQVENEEVARTFQIPREVDTKTWQWPHGLTPPMHNVRKRRFRKRVSHRTIEAAEEEVERLLAADEQARAHNGSADWRILDIDSLRREEGGEDGYEDEDAEGDEDIEYLVEEDDEATVMARMEQALGADDDEDSKSPLATQASSTILMPTVELEAQNVGDANIISADGETQGEIIEDVEAESEDDVEDEGEDDDEDEDEEDEEDEEYEAEVDENAREMAQQLAQQREEIAYLEQQLAMQREAYAKQENPLLRQRLVGKIKSFEADLQVKKRALGIADDDL